MSVIPRSPVSATKEAEEKMSMEQQFFNSALNCLQKIAQDNLYRLKECASTPSVLNSGIFYPNEYYYALLKTKKQKVAEKADPAVVQAIQKRIDTMIQDGTFFHGAAPKSHFKMQESQIFATGFVPVCFTLKDKSIIPSEALSVTLGEEMQTVKSLKLMDCMAACHLAYTKGLIDVLGKEKFNGLFSYDAPLPFVIGKGIEGVSYFNVLEKQVKGPAKKGDLVIFSGHPDYQIKHINGEATTFNTLCKDDKKGNETYLGLGLNPEGASRNAIMDVFLEEYNVEPIDFRAVTEVVREKVLKTTSKKIIEKSESLKNHTITRRDLKKVMGQQPVAIYRINMDRIKQLCAVEVEQGKQLMQKWKWEFLGHR